MVGVARDDDGVVIDHAPEAECLADLAAGAEHELDLAHAEAQRLQRARETDAGGQPLGTAVVRRRAGGRGRRLVELRLARSGRGGFEGLDGGHGYLA